MKKVLVTGSGGAGKTTFSDELSKRTGIPAVHLDYYFHQDTVGHTEYPEKWIKIVNKLLEKDSWIMEGNYSSTYKDRFAIADTFIFMDIPTYVTIYGVFKRRFQYRNKKRPEMPDDWDDKLNREFIKYVLRFKKDSRQKLLNEMKMYSHENLDVKIFKTRKEAYKWLDSVVK